MVVNSFEGCAMPSSSAQYPGGGGKEEEELNARLGYPMNCGSQLMESNVLPFPEKYGTIY